MSPVKIGTVIALDNDSFRKRYLHHKLDIDKAYFLSEDRRCIVTEDKSYIMKTLNVYNREEAVNSKMKQIHPKLFGLFCPVKYKLLSTENVYVPYMLLIFNYRVVRNPEKQRQERLGKFDREGQIGIVFDMNEVHAFHYDLYDELGLVKAGKDKISGKFIKANCTEREAIDNSIECVKWQYLRKVFHAVPEITLADKQMFYREAVKLDLECRNKHYEKFAYKDRFGAKNEHISGLRVRLDV